mgnify:FL=1
MSYLYENYIYPNKLTNRMKITLIRAEKESGKEALSTLETDALIKKLKTETKAGHVSTLRAILPQLEGTCAQYEHIDKLPRIYPAVEYSRTQEGERRMKNYNGLVQLEINRLSGIAEAEYVKQQAALLPQTFAAFCGSSGRSAKIWVLFALPDGTTPKRESDATLFHAHAYRMAVKCYQPLLPFAITLKEPSLTQSCRMTLDGYPYYNPAAVPFCLEQPLSMPEEENFRQRKLAEKNPLLRLHPDSKASDTFAVLFESALDRAFRGLGGWKRDGDLRILLVPLAEHCFKAGIPEEEVVRQTLMHYYREADEFIVRQTIHNLYQELKGFGKKSSLTQEQESVFRLEEFMGRRYEFRYNTVLDDLEYRQRDSVHFYFKPADQRARSTVSMNALKEGIRVWDRDINRFLTSDYVPLYNPVEEYLYDTGRWDGKDRIRALADLVPCHNPHWRELFYRWFLGMVAHWRGMDRQHGNNTSPLLVGSQGFRKSTFCRILLPPELRRQNLFPGAAFRLYGQHRLQEQAGSRTQSGTLSARQH